MFPCSWCSPKLTRKTRTLSIEGSDKSILVTQTRFPDVDVNDVLVEVNFATITINDAKQFVSGVTFAPGQCFSGIVKEAGARSGYVIGDYVYGWIETGAMSETIVTSASNVAKVPSGMKMHVASTLPYIGWIAYKIFEKGPPINESSRVYINAEGILNNILNGVSRQKTPNVSGTIDEDTIVYEGLEFSVDLYVEALGMKDRIVTVSRSGYYLSDISSPNLQPLEYRMKDSKEFGEVVRFLNKNYEVLDGLSCLFVHFKSFDRHFRIVAESLKKLNPSPFVIEIKPELFDRFGSSFQGSPSR